MIFRLRSLIALVIALPAGSAFGECVAAAPGPDAAEIQQLRQSLDAYEDAVLTTQFDEAEVLARQIMELSIRVNGRFSVNTANALTNLAYAQYKQARFETAKLNYEAAVSTIEDIDGYLSPDLIRPLHRLGETEARLGNDDAAIDLFQRAVRVGHVNKGPQNLEQVASLNAIAEVNRRAGRMRRALDIQQMILGVQQRAVGVDDEAVIPAMQNYADWMRKLGLYNKERNTYLRMLEIQEQNFGEDDPRLIPTLLVIGGSFHQFGHKSYDDMLVVRLAGATPDFFLRRAQRIADGQPEPNWEIAAHTAIQVGDYYTKSHGFHRARKAYVEAWDKLSVDSAGLADRAAMLEWPVLLEDRELPAYYLDQVPIYAPENTDEYRRGSIAVVFDLDRKGRTRNLRVVEYSPGGQPDIERILRDTLSYVMHRPRLQDGVPAPTRNIDFVYEFFYRDTAAAD